MVYSTSIPIIKPNIYTHQYSKRRPIYTHQNGNINPTSYTLLNIELHNYYPEPKYLIIGSFGRKGLYYTGSVRVYNHLEGKV